MWKSVGHLLLVILPVSAIGTVLLAMFLPETLWPAAALFVTVGVAVSLATWQLRRAWDQRGRDISPFTLSFLNSMGAGEVDYAKSRAIDRWILDNRGRLLALSLAAVALSSVLLRMMAPAMPWFDAVALSYAGCIVLAAVIFSPWYSYRKLTSLAPWRTFLILTAAIGGWTAVAFFAVLSSDTPRIADLGAEKLLRAAAISLLVGVAVASLMLTISRFRLREELHRAAAEAEREKLERQKTQAELKLLQAQVEPHFLFNTLANLRQLMKSRPEEAVAMLDHLTRYLRTSLPEMRGEASTLGREGELAAAYLEIMAMRMGTLHFSVEIPPALASQPFPPLMVMTLVENAVKHGVGPLGGGLIRVVARRKDDRIEVDVEDDGRGLAGELGRGVGLANVRERLKALYGEGASLALVGGDVGGTRARLTVPA
jgi:signal transduction histidine kinase